jgi:hypothetical protein
MRYRHLGWVHKIVRRPDNNALSKKGVLTACPVTPRPIACELKDNKYVCCPRKETTITAEAPPCPSPPARGSGSPGPELSLSQSMDYPMQQYLDSNRQSLAGTRRYCHLTQHVRLTEGDSYDDEYQLQSCQQPYA